MQRNDGVSGVDPRALTALVGLDLTTGKVEIVSMNHGFTVDRDSLPEAVSETHVSLFDGTNCGIALTGRPVFSVQHHPEASPGPTDSLHLFQRIADAMKG